MHIEITLDRRKKDFLETPHINVVTVPTIDKYTLYSELVTNAQILSNLKRKFLETMGLTAEAAPELSETHALSTLRRSREEGKHLSFFYDCQM